MRPTTTGCGRGDSKTCDPGCRTYTRVLFLLLSVLVLACGTGETPPAGELRHLILITVDTWRADHFLVSKAGVPLTPNLEQLAARSVRFRANSSVGAVTAPGIAGILTGLLPHRSGVVVNDHLLPDSLPTLATELRDHGFVTAAFVANPVIAPGFGFNNGFAQYELVARRPPLRKATAAQVNRQAFNWLDALARPPENLFLWMHYMEPHGPYEPPDEHARLFSVEDFDAPSDIPLLPPGRNGGLGGIPHYQQIERRGRPATSDGRDYLLRYAAAVRCVDHEIGLLLRSLEARRFMEHALIVVTADHGEALAGDHGYFFSHDNNLTEDQVAVPLMISYPGCEAGKVVDLPSSATDILPTVMHLLGLRAPDEFDGTALLDDTRTGYAVSDSGRERAIRWRNWRLRLTAREALLFDLDTDLGEQVDLSDRYPERFRQLKGQLQEMTRRPPLATSINRQHLDEEQRRSLKALGYL